MFRVSTKSKIDCTTAGRRCDSSKLEMCSKQKCFQSTQLAFVASSGSLTQVRSVVKV